MICRANYSRGQLKIQQMAFVLVALVIFFAIVSLFYFNISFSNLKGEADLLKEEEAGELVRKLVGTPEFSWRGDCVNCIDMDKVFLLKERNSYKDFWNLRFLQIDKVYPSSKEECNKANYPECETITLIRGNEIGTPNSAFVSLCRWEQEKGGYTKCELGRIYASAKK